MPSKKIVEVVESLPAELKQEVLQLKGKKRQGLRQKPAPQALPLAFALHRAGVTFRNIEQILPLRLTSGMNASRIVDAQVRANKAQADKVRRARIKAEKNQEVPVLA